MTNIDHYDFVVIGGGPAGQGAAEVAAIYGHKTLVIERNVLGGVVVTTGGAPTKTLRDAALYLTGFRDRDVYGLMGQIDPVLPANVFDPGQPKCVLRCRNAYV